MALIVGCLFLIVSVYVLFRSVKRDKIIAISIFLCCSIVYILTELKINSHNAKAEIYFGVYDLVLYDNSTDCKIEILSENRYKIFNDRGVILNGEWELMVKDDNSTMLLMDGKIFGVGDLDIR